MIDMNIIRDKFFVDPDWHNVEQLIMDYLNPLIEMDDVDETQSAETVKAEIVGRKKLYKQMCLFLESTGIVKNVSNYPKTNQFK